MRVRSPTATLCGPILRRLADLGFDVDIGPLFMTPREVAQHAVDAGGGTSAAMPAVPLQPLLLLPEQAACWSGGLWCWWSAQLLL